MSWNFLIWFGVAVGVYILICLVRALIKRYKQKHNKGVDNNNQ